LIYIIAISAVAAAIHFSMALLCLTLARAPGWQSYRVFAAIAFTMGIYALNDAFVLNDSAVSSLTNICATINVSIATLTPSLWLVFSRMRDQQKLGMVDKVLLAFLLPCFLLTLVPGVVVDGTRSTAVHSMGIFYRTPKETSLGVVIYAAMMLTMFIIAGRNIQLAYRGSAAQKLSAFGFSVFVLLAFEEVLVSQGLLDWPYLVDLGFTGITLSFAIEMSSRVSSETRARIDLNHTLEEQIHARSSELSETREALLVAERHAAMGQLASAVGHEINNPLAYISGNLSFLSEQPGKPCWDKEEAEAIEEAIDGVQRIRRIVRDLTIFSSESKKTAVTANVHRAIESAIRVARTQKYSDFKFKTELLETSSVEIDESKLTQVLVNLIVNACHASKDCDNPTIIIRCFSDNKTHVIEVIDEGIGIEKANIDRVFDPLFTTKDVGEGTGLGLFVCRGIIDEAGGLLDIASQPGVGTTLRITLTTTETPSTATKAPTPKAGTVKTTLIEGLKIYVIDDEPMVVRAMERMLKSAEVVVENDSMAAFEHLQQSPSYDVIICDLMMPALTGMDLYARLEAADSSLLPRFLFLTAGAMTLEATEFLERPGIQHILKPVTARVLRTRLSEFTSSNRD